MFSNKSADIIQFNNVSLPETVWTQMLIGLNAFFEQ